MTNDPAERPTPAVADVEPDDARMERVLRDLAVANDCTPEDEPGLPPESESP